MLAFGVLAYAGFWAVLIGSAALESGSGSANRVEIRQQIESAFGPIGGDFEIVHNEWSTSPGDSLASYGVVLPDSTFAVVLDRLDLSEWERTERGYQREDAVGVDQFVALSIVPDKRRLNYTFADL